jgi:hypothetical protein
VLIALKILISRELFIWIGLLLFRNIGDRILLGGGRNLDFDVENTTEFAQTEIVQNKLEELLKVILPNQNLKLPIVGVESWASVIARTLSFPCLKMSIVALD